MNENYNNNKCIILGILLSEVKRKKFQLPMIIQEKCKQDNIKIVAIDFFRDLADQGPFDVLLHKIGDYHKENTDYEETEMLIKNIMNYAKQHPKMYVIDDFDVVRNLINRKIQFEILDKCTMNVDGIHVYIPKSLKIDNDTSVEDIRKSIVDSGMKFPVLAKPLAAIAHKFTIVFSIDYLVDIPVPCLLQEFCNHAGVIYKVFVLGDRINFCERPSIQDVDCSSTRKSLLFDSRDVSKTGKAFIPELHATDPNLRKWLSCQENPDMLNKDVVMALHKRIFELTSLQLYSLDILIDKKGNYAIVDLNHFPGYTGVKKEIFNENLVELIKQCAKKKRDLQASLC